MASNKKDSYVSTSIVSEIKLQKSNINKIVDRIKFLEEKIGDPVKFSETFHEAYIKTKKVEWVVLDSLIKLLKYNEETKESISDSVNQVDRNNFKRLLNKIGSGLLGAFIFVSGVIVTIFIERFIKL